MPTTIIDDVKFKVADQEWQVVGHEINKKQPTRNGMPYGKTEINTFWVKLISNDTTTLSDNTDNSTKSFDVSIEYYSAGALVNQITAKAFFIQWEHTGEYHPNGGISNTYEKVTLKTDTVKFT